MLAVVVPIAVRAGRVVAADLAPPSGQREEFRAETVISVGIPPRDVCYSPVIQAKLSPG